MAAWLHIRVATCAELALAAEQSWKVLPGVRVARFGTYLKPMQIVLHEKDAEVTWVLPNRSLLLRLRRIPPYRNNADEDAIPVSRVHHRNEMCPERVQQHAGNYP